MIDTDFTINDVYPWGRSFGEYCRMFGLGEEELGLRIVGCGDGPAAFNAEATRRGGRVVSCDPLYRFTADEIGRRIDATRPEMLRLAAENRSRFVWKEIRDLDALERLRMGAMQVFLADYEQGRREGRYLDQSLPEIALADGSFDLALCSHLLFLYADRLSYAFHGDSVVEMCRIASEARIFPLVDLEGNRPVCVDRLVDELRRDGFAAAIETVDYEFQRGGDEMLRVRRAR